MKWSVLKAKLLAYPTLAWNMLLGRILKVRNWSDPVDDQIVLGAYPFDADIPGLAQSGVTSVLNTCEEYPGPVGLYGQYKIEQCRVPMVDFTHPSLANIEKGVDFIEREIAKGGKVYVHCKAGRARSATIVLCWLMKQKGMTAEEAQAYLLKKRPQVNPRIMNRKGVREFEAKLNRERVTAATASDTASD
ncbi:MAG: dual specificity protein phosphatase family protein [Mariniblastus sp.]|nr:dual specificity protein phosphatase family protein [Mariniblastus sp.]